MFYKNIIVVSMFLALTGCNGSSSDSPDNTSQTVTTKQFTIIDGYLKDAQVYVDRNANQVADEDELVGSTDENGQITINNVSDGQTIIAVIDAGTTTDQDFGSVVGHSYQMASNSSSSVITPFTTLAVKQNISLADVASLVNLPESVVSGDYVNAQSEDADRAHLIARSATRTLSDLSSSDDDMLDNFADFRDSAAEVPASQLNSVNLEIYDGKVTQIAAKPTLKEFLQSGSLTSFSLNEFWRHLCEDEDIDSTAGENCSGLGDGSTQWTFDLSDATNPTVILSDANNSETNTYQVKFDINFAKGLNAFSLAWVANGQTQNSEMKDNFIYTENGLAIAVSVDSDLQLYTTAKTNQSLTGFSAITLDESQWQGKTFYHLNDTKQISDDYPWKAEPQMTAVKPTVISTSGSIRFGDTEYTVLQETPDLYLIKDANNHPSLLIKDKAMAERLMSDWQKMPTEQN